MRNSAYPIRGAAPETPRFIAVAPESLCYFGAAFTAPAIPASESTLGSHLCVALSSAQMFSEWTTSTQPCNDFSLDGNYPLNLLSHSRGSLQQLRLVIHELAQPTPAMTRVANKLTRPVYERVLALIGQIIHLAPENQKTRLCTHSVMGQIMLYVLARPFLMRLWPDMKLSPEQLDRIADHIADFSLAYLRQAGAQKRVASATREGSGK